MTEQAMALMRARNRALRWPEQRRTDPELDPKNIGFLIAAILSLRSQRFQNRRLADKRARSKLKLQADTCQSAVEPGIVELREGLAQRRQKTVLPSVKRRLRLLHLGRRIGYGKALPCRRVTISGLISTWGSVANPAAVARAALGRGRLTRPRAAHRPAGRLRSARTGRGRGALDQTRLANDVAREVEDRRLTLAQRTHHLKALDRRIGRLHRFETPHRPDQLLELAMVGLDDVVQILDLPVLGVLGTLAFGLQFGESGGIGRRLVGVDDLRLFPILQTPEALGQKTLRRRRVSRRRDVEIDRVAQLVDGSVEVRPFRSRRPASSPSAVGASASAAASRFRVRTSAPICK